MIKGLCINEKDNVIVAIENINKNEEIEYKNKKNEIKKLKVLEDITIYHKIATEDIAEDEIIIKYGEHIGKAIKSIRKGSHVHIHNVVSEKN